MMILSGDPPRSHVLAVLLIVIVALLVLTPWLFAQVPAAALAAGLYGILEGWLAVDGARDWWPMRPPPENDEIDFGLDADDLTMPGVFPTHAAEPPGERTPRTVVQPGAIVHRGGRDVVFVVKDGKASEAAVRTAGRIGDLVEVASGVKAGDKVVLKPSRSLRDGSTVSTGAK